MEFLLTMTTHVPVGTSGAAVDEVRAREAARSRELAAQGHLLRLWRPPLQPGEWRTLGLFVAADVDALEADLASMPLRVWRTDEVTPLTRHPNDPSLPAGAGAAWVPGSGDREFLTTFALSVPAATPTATVDTAAAREAERTLQLARQGHLLRLWTLPGEGRALGLWRAHDEAEMASILASLPLDAWLEVHTTPLTPHPSDPAAVTSGSGEVS